MKIKNQRGFITVYVLISTIFLITLISISLLLVSRKVNNQTEINSVIYKTYNSEQISELIVNNALEIPVYSKEQFMYLEDWILNEDSKTEYMNVKGRLYKLDNTKKDDYKISLKTDLYFNLYDGEKVRIKVEDKVIANEFKIEVAGLKENYYKTITTPTEGVVGLVVIPKGFALIDTTTEMPVKIPDYKENYDAGYSADITYKVYNNYITKNIIEDGLVVQDTANNEFVWIPINDINEMVMCQQADGTNNCNIILNNSNTPICTTHGNETKMAGKLYKDYDSITESNSATVWDKIFVGNIENGIADKSLRLKYTNKNDSAETSEPYEGTDDYQYNYTKLNGEILKFTKVDYYQPEFNLMVKNVIINKGFYVGRYETGGFDLDSNVAVVRKGEDYISTTGTKVKIDENNKIVKDENNNRVYEMNGSNNTKATWIGMVGAQSEFALTVGEKTIWKGDYNKTYKQIEEDNNIVNSSMIWGSQHDQVLKFVNGKKDGTNDIYNVNVADQDRCLGDSSNDFIDEYGNLIKTGAIIADKVANIFGLQCHMWERTLERSSSTRYEIRGGHYYSGVNAARRRNVASIGSQAETSTGSRMTLNIESNNVNLIIYKDAYSGKNYLLYKYNKFMTDEIEEQLQKMGIKKLILDVDGDCRITENDYNLILNHVKKIQQLTDEQFEIADRNKDGKITVNDYSNLLKIEKGLEPLYPEWK